MLQVCSFNFRMDRGSSRGQEDFLKRPSELILKSVAVRQAGEGHFRPLKKKKKDKYINIVGC